MGDQVEGAKNPYESATKLGSSVNFSYLPEEDRKRAEAYLKYDQLYWNEDGQYSLRLLDGEEPTYIPNPRTVVDTTAHFLLKGLRISPRDPEKPAGAPVEMQEDEEAGAGEAAGKPREARKSASMGDALKAFLDREMFYARFQNAKHAGVARGDWCFHMTADPEAEEGKRISLTPVQPWKVILEEDPDDSTSITQAYLVDTLPHPDDDNKTVVQVLRYWYEDSEGGTRTVMRELNLWSSDQAWYNEDDRELVRTVLSAEALPVEITTIPVYMFHNINWDGSTYGTSELRGFEKTAQAISQVATDQSAALALEGLGCYATDGGRPVDNAGVERDWEIAPGRVMELKDGNYFRRIEGVGSVKPTMDHIEYLESKIREAGGLSDVALGRVDVATAQSGIALAVKFMPTLAKLEERDELGMGRLRQMFFDWKAWHKAYEGQEFTEEIVVTVGDKLPSNRTERVNELNNMLDRGVISKKYYRSEMQNLGYVFPDDIEEQIDAEKQKEAEQKALAAPPGLQENAEDAANGEKQPPPAQLGVKGRKKEQANRSNNAGKPNESSGTEATQSVESQARGGKSLVDA